MGLKKGVLYVSVLSLVSIVVVLFLLPLRNKTTSSIDVDLSTVALEYPDTKIQPYPVHHHPLLPINPSVRKTTLFNSTTTVTSAPAVSDNDDSSVIDPSALPMSVCHGTNDVTTTVTPVHIKNVLVFGGTSFMGSKVATGLNNGNFHVGIVEYEVDQPLGTMASYRRNELLAHKGIKMNLVKSDKSNDIPHILSSQNIDSVVFIPSPIFDGNLKQDVVFERKRTVEILERFVHLLEAAKARSGKQPIQILLLTLPRVPGFNSIQNSWLRSFEVSASSYQGLYGMQTKVLRVDKVYGEWAGEDNDEGGEPDVFPKVGEACLYINNVIEAVEKLLNNQENCFDVDMLMNEECTEEKDKFADTMSWAEEYTSSERSKKDVVFSTYFTKARNPMYSYRIKPKSGFFMKQWLTSARRLGLNLVIMHDAFDTSFMNHIKSIYPNVEFVSTSGSLNGRTTNDFRFYAFKNYLEEHPEVRRAVLTDMRDVKFFADPFEQMEAIGDYIYIGIDVSFYLSSFDHSWLRGVLRYCHRSEATSNPVKLHPFLNAGVLGGSRHKVLAFLRRMTQYLDKSPHHNNCNMGTINLVGHKYFFETSYSGYPIQSAFKLGMEGAIPQGQSIKHKDTEKYSY